MSIRYKSMDFITLGNAYVGKTNLSRVFSEGGFQKAYNNTIGVDFYDKKIILDDQHININIWDTAGSERYQSLTKTYLQRAQGAICVYAVNDRESFERVEHWIEQANTCVEDLCIVLVANKCDLKEERVVSSQEGKKLANKLGFKFFETSVMLEENVRETFIELCRDVITQGKRREEQDKLNNVRREPVKPVSLKQLAREENKAWCCLLS